MKTIITNGTIVTGGESFTGTVVLKDGLIDSVERGHSDLSSCNSESQTIIDAKGCYVAPGFIDMSASGYETCPENLVFLDHASGHRPPRHALDVGYDFLEIALR